MDLLIINMHFLISSIDFQIYFLYDLKMIEEGAQFYKYIPESNEAKRWGIYVTDLGYTSIPAGGLYPPSPHPMQYTLNKKMGRILTEYQIVYITRGQGKFWSETSGNKQIKEGSVFLLFPGIRHRYAPNPQTGWDEHWIGFSGDRGVQLMEEFFDPAQPVIQAGMEPDLSILFSSTCDLANHEVFGFRQIIAAKAVEILARVQALARGESLRSPHNESLMRKTCCLLNDGAFKKIYFEEYAAENGMSYSSFRRLFKNHTGLAPNQYQIEMRVRKAQSLLISTTLSVQQIADEIGFDSLFYFSRIFKNRTGISPLNYRKKFY